MGKKDTENAVYIAIITSGLGILADMLLNPCGKHWIPFFNSPSVDVACILQKGGFRLLPPIPPFGGRGKGSSRYKSRAGELSDLAEGKGKGDDGGDDDDSGGSGGSGIPFTPKNGGSGKRKKEKRPREDEPAEDRSLEDILKGIGQERRKEETKSGRRKRTASGIESPIDDLVGGAGDTLDDLIARAGDIYSGTKVPSFGEGILKGLEDIGKNAVRTWEEWMNPKGNPLEELLRGKPIGPIRVRYSEYYPYEYY